MSGCVFPQHSNESGALLEAPERPPSSDAAATPVASGPSEPRPLPPFPRPRPQRRLGGGWMHAFSLVLVGYLCLFHLSVVRGSSMSPSIHDGDRILIDPLSYLFGGVERGDIVVLQYPLDPSVDYIKRVVGLPGDEIVIEGSEVRVNGELLAEPYVDNPDPFSSITARVKPAHYFVLGDNRARSCDSREFGQVPAGYVRGKVEVRVWPLTRAGLINL